MQIFLHEHSRIASMRNLKAQQINTLTYVSAVQLVNAQTRKNVLVYAQYDPGSQVTLISKTLLEELSLVFTKNSGITLHTITGKETGHYENVVFYFEALHTSKRFSRLSALLFH